MTVEAFNSLYRDRRFFKRVRFLCNGFFASNRQSLQMENIWEAADLESLAWQHIFQERKGGQAGNYYLQLVKWRLLTLLTRAKRKALRVTLLPETIPSSKGFNADGEREEDVSLFDQYAQMEHERVCSIEEEHKGIFDCELILSENYLFQMIRVFQPGALFIDFEAWECFLHGRFWRKAKLAERYRLLQNF